VAVVTSAGGDCNQTISRPPSWAMSARISWLAASFAAPSIARQTRVVCGLPSTNCG
jgi:hypothetical protein